MRLEKAQFYPDIVKIWRGGRGDGVLLNMCDSRCNLSLKATVQKRFSINQPPLEIGRTSFPLLLFKPLRGVAW
jgi:hypothetical protein